MNQIFSEMFDEIMLVIHNISLTIKYMNFNKYKTFDEYKTKTVEDLCNLYLDEHTYFTNDDNDSDNYLSPLEELYIDYLQLFGFYDIYPKESKCVLTDIIDKARNKLKTLIVNL